MQTFCGVKFQPEKVPRVDIFLLQKDIVDETHIRMGGLKAKGFLLLWVQTFCDVFGCLEFQREGLLYLGG